MGFLNRTLPHLPSVGRFLGRVLGRRSADPDGEAWRARVVPLGPFSQQTLGSERIATMYLPPGYDAARPRPYPLLLLQDGQNLFFAERSFAGEAWDVGRTADRLISSWIVEPLVIVGIDHGGAERIEEYTPTRDLRHQAGGGAGRYRRFLFEQVIPEVERRANVSGGEMSIGGSSLGALLALETALSEPFAFRAVAALSPSVWWDEKWIVLKAGLLPPDVQLRVWLDIGTNEGTEAVHGARLLRDTLVKRGFRRNRDLFYREFRGAGHHERAWRQRFDSVLRALFPRSQGPAASSSPSGRSSQRRPGR